MRGVVSFHPVDLEFFDGIVAPLVGGRKTNPEAWVERSVRIHASAHVCGCYRRGIEDLLASLEPPPHPTEGTLWTKMRSRLERLDFKPDPLIVEVSSKIERDLHFEGRPFLIFEGSADRVAILVDEFAGARGEKETTDLVLEQLVRLHAKLPARIKPREADAGPADMTYRRDLLAGLREMYDLPAAARQGGEWGPAGRPREPARDVLIRELPWKAVDLHGRAVPFWIGRDVDGLETICRAAGIEAPDCLAPAWRLFSDACNEFGGLRETMGHELRGPRDVGAFAAPDAIPDLLGFLAAEGSRIIRAASQHGQGETCATLLRKIRECAQYAERHGMGYLEASGILPPGTAGKEEPADGDPAAV